MKNSLLKSKIQTIWTGFQKENEIFFYFDDEEYKKYSFKLPDYDNFLIEDRYDENINIKAIFSAFMEKIKIDNI